MYICYSRINHKLRVDQEINGKDFNIRFETASKEEIDNTYYDQYGYDEYYYIIR